eukprot:TRINITY_DN445_c0_g1_i3.p2 TRINITY_DN445_c0_g1~~TRINITY_DN445_c0_g1_i3.p2  ORF type:complete len:638 (+),score=193.19 TRINITY_DN445_c0_g1_i3:94-2007(+)
MKLAALALAAALPTASSWYIPGVMPTSYTRGAPIGIKVNSLSSIQNIMPFEWYSLPFCAPPREDRKKYMKSQNLGEVLWGDKIEISLYRAELLVNTTCRLVCPKQEYSQAQSRQFLNRIEQKYRGNMVLDNLPVAEEGTGKSSQLMSQVVVGFPLGVPRAHTEAKQTFLHNHLAFTVTYHQQPKTAGEWAGGQDPPDLFRIVGFQVTPYSIDHTEEQCRDEKFNPDTGSPLALSPNKPASVTWSYSVKWEEDTSADWSTRWDVYLRHTSGEARIHWFAIINSLLVVVFLSAIVAIIMLRALHKDFNRYNDPENVDESQEETGWKLVHSDVFRAPPHPAMLAVYVGTGAQLLGMTLCTLIFALFGFLSPANRGALLSALIFLFVLLGSYAGFTASRLLKFFELRNWKYIFMTGLWFPGHMFGTWFLLNLMMWANGSASAVPFTTILTLMALWLGVSLVLVLLGAVVGFKRAGIEVPCKVNIVPRTIPPQPWYLRAPQSILLPGILPFGAAFIESVFILSSIWQGRVYYVFGFLALVFVILIITCAEATIVTVYFQLIREDYRWWWKSFGTSASYGLWLYMYCIFYYATALHIPNFWASVLYFGYMGMASYFAAVLTGTIGFGASFLFVHKIYSSIKVD